MSEQELYMMSEEKAKVREGSGPPQNEVEAHPCPRRASASKLVFCWWLCPCETLYCCL